MNSVLFFVLEILGTVAFSVSGAMVAFESEMDIFGVAVLGMTTAVGGGIIRDIILGRIPPVAFIKPVYAFVALCVAIIVFIKPIRTRLKENDIIILILDSIGLGVFTVVGCTSALTLYGNNHLLSVFVGVVTGVGGGVMRDIFARKTPYIFYKHFYACASLIGAIVCTVSVEYLSKDISMALGASVIIVLRLLAAKFRWKLPK